ncbi:hypothetical protein [Acinetobacter sp. ANC 4648]|uniref:hypothetical protein n=1 Tax=Acinetobacter sp. ANC 4648 TaxID=1977875 RepID=UPI000A33773B|nr:hypothetical protein [Acinetobacter sp. ANC 4648]OTG84957.1 hypothetical protein B9T27_01680 [Acinetobacter sp. ANC 4648]
MKLISTIKTICFVGAGLYLFGLTQDIYVDDIDPLDLLGNLGIIFVLLEIGIALYQDKDTHKLSFKTLFARDTLVLSPLEQMANFLGRVGMVMIMLSVIYNFIDT